MLESREIMRTAWVKLLWKLLATSPSELTLTPEAIDDLTIAIMYVLRSKPLRKENQEWIMSDLRNELNTTWAKIQESINKLEKTGFVKRRKAGTMHKNYISLTNKGRIFLAEVDLYANQQVQEIQAKYSQTTSQMTVTELINEIIDYAETTSDFKIKMMQYIQELEKRGLKPQEEISAEIQARKHNQVKKKILAEQYDWNEERLEKIQATIKNYANKISKEIINEAKQEKEKKIKEILGMVEK